MATDFPGSDDVFTEPSSPGSTALVSAGTGSRNHTQHHRDLGDAVEAMQAQSTLLAHSHDGSTARHGSKLAQANTHQSPDTNSATSSLHHTIGTSATQAAAGNHTHTQATSHSSPDTDSLTSSLHHTIGSSSTQAAAGNHNHSATYSALAHTHTQATSHSSPDTDSATSSLHHTLGTGANQASAGDHTHDDDSGLLSAPAGSGWDNSTSTYRRINGMVHITLNSTRNGGALAANADSTLFIMPVGYRCDQGFYYIGMMSNGVVVRGVCGSGGEITINDYATGFGNGPQMTGNIMYFATQ